MENYRIAIIGLGGMGGAHAAAAQLETNCELVAGAEINPERAKAWSERFGVKAIYDDYEKMLDQEQPDIVIVPTQAPMHHPPTIAAAQRGIHVFCEKPTALNLIEADDMVETCDQHHVKFAINHIKRASPYNRHVLSLIEKGDIGDVVLLKATDKGGRKVGNSLMEMGTHLYDWLRLFAGDVEWTHAHLVQMDGRESTLHDIKHTQEVHPHSIETRGSCLESADTPRSASRTASMPTCSSSRNPKQTIMLTASTSSALKAELLSERASALQCLSTKGNTRHRQKHGNPSIYPQKTWTSRGTREIRHRYGYYCNVSCSATSLQLLKKTGIPSRVAEMVETALK